MNTTMMNLWNPLVVKETCAGEREVYIQSILLNQRRILLNGEINESSASAFLLQLMYLTSIDDSPITVYIDSPGGDVTQGLLIVDSLRTISADVKIVCCGMAASIAAVILIAGGRKGNRFIFPHSKVVLHEVYTLQNGAATASRLEEITDNILKCKSTINELLAWNSGNSVEEIEKITSSEHSFVGEEAVRLGFVDEIYMGEIHKAFPL